MRSTSRPGPRPRALLAILVWAVVVGAGLVAAAVAVVVRELRPVRSWADDFAARGVLAVGALPLAAFRTAPVRGWVAGAPKPARTNAPSPWAERLSPAAMRYLAGVWLARLTAYLFAVVLLSSIGFAAIDGPTAGRTMAAVAGAGIAGSLVGWFLLLRAVRNDVAEAHDLPRGACRYVLFTDPAAFDATLTGALRAAGRLPHEAPAVAE